MDDPSSKEPPAKGKTDKPEAQEPVLGDLPPPPVSPARTPTPVLLKHLQSAIDRLKRGNS
jgi:hypothetical protein